MARITLSLLLPPLALGWLPPRVARASAVLCAEASAPTPLARCASRLADAADAIVAAAAVLGENQCQEEEPGRLSAGGCALANAGRDVELMGQHISDADWPAATEPLAAVAVSLASAATFLEGLVEASALLAAADECEEASCVTGCISLAAAAGPNIEAAGLLITEAGGAIAAHGEGMLSAGTSAAHTEAGRQLCEAGAAVEGAGEHMAVAGRRLEDGVAS